jgi:hypothetical protein
MGLNGYGAERQQRLEVLDGFGFRQFGEQPVAPSERHRANHIARVCSWVIRRSPSVKVGRHLITNKTQRTEVRLPNRLRRNAPLDDIVSQAHCAHSSSQFRQSLGDGGQSPDTYPELSGLP